MYKSHVPSLVMAMGDKKNEVLAESALQALAAVCKVDSTVCPSET
jgi:hypothetical protein